MAKQKGIIKIDGTIGDITFVKTQDGYIAKQKTSLKGERIATDPAFKRTRENGAEFGRAGKAGKVLRNAVRTVLQNAKDKRVTSRLTGEMMKVVKADSTSTRGLRNVLDGELELLRGFDFNINAKLGTTLYALYTGTIDRVAGTATVAIPSFIPAERIAAPAGSTHFNIVSMGAEVDFENQTFITDNKQSGILPWDNTATAALNLANVVTVNSTHPLFLLLGIQFFQQVNGINYPLKNGAFNALSLIEVSGI
ncbi:MAG TPA: hypothetical protein PLX74_12470 [Chitinophagaceae bacterium]|nr:hypothetical protein [Chitinophagaceae bacterium]